MTPDLIVFDFDGTLVDSAGVKTGAFAVLYEDEGDEVAAAMFEHHLEHQGVSRFDKIRWVEERVLGRRPSDDAIAARAQRFADLVAEGVRRASLMPGVDRFLQAHAGSIPLAVVSATPTDELEAILSAKGLRPYFGFVGGSPTPKVELIALALDAAAAAAHRAVVVGDQLSDLEAARDAGCAFVAFTGDESATFPEGTPTISTLDELPERAGEALGLVVGDG